MTPIGRRQTGRLLSPIAVTLLAAAVAIAACDPNVANVGGNSGKTGSANPSGGTPTPSPTPSGLTGGVGDRSPSPTPTSGSSTSGSASPTPTPQPSTDASPTPTPPPAVAQYILMSPTTGLTIHLPPPAGATPLPGMPSTLQLTAEVRLSNGTIDSRAATWTSSDEAIAAVSPSGLVSAKFKTGSVRITAISADQQASESVTITVKSVGAASVEVE